MTDEAAVAAGAKQVEAALAGETLSGLVNNAGIAVPGPLLDLKIDDFERQITINLAGPLIVTQAFAPLLGADRSRKGAPGRIVMISSVGGKNALPFNGAYSASKFGLEGHVGIAAPRADDLRRRRDHRGAGLGGDADLGQGRRRRRHAIRQQPLRAGARTDEARHGFHGQGRACRRRRSAKR